MPFSCDRFQLQTQAELARTLTELITGLRLVLIHPDMANSARLAEVAALLDAVAPPPGPAGTGWPTPASRTARAAVTHSRQPVPAW